VTRRAPSSGGIGTLNETSLHDALKRRFSDDPACHEVHIGGVVADVYTGGRVYEIQTKGCIRLVPKLQKLLPEIPVTVVIPAPASKRIWWIEPETGEASGGRVSSKHALRYELWRELPPLLPFLDTPGFQVTLLLLEWDEYIIRDGYGPRKARRATRADRVLRGEAGSFTISSLSRLGELIPDGLPASFRSQDFAKACRIPRGTAQTALRILWQNGFLDRTGRDRLGYIYRQSRLTNTDGNGI